MNKCKIGPWALLVLGLFLSACGREPDPVPPGLEYPGTQNRFDLRTSWLSLSVGRTPTLYASFDPGGVYRKTLPDGKWIPVYGGVKTPRALVVEASPFETDTVFVGTNSDGVYKSIDRGTTWRPVHRGLTSMTIEDIDFHPRNRKIVYVTTRRGGVFKSTDGGESWGYFGEGLEIVRSLEPFEANFLNKLFVEPTDGEPVLFLATTYGLYRRDPQDSAWRLLQDPSPGPYHRFARDPRNGDLYVVRGAFLLRSMDGGNHWEVTGDAFYGLARSVIVGDDGDSLFIALAAGGIKRSIDKGKTWQPANRGLPAQNVEALIYDRKRKTLYAGMLGFGMYMSSDHGEHWVSMNEDFPAVPQFDFTAVAGPVPAAEGRPPVPPEFAHTCNLCHGWTDPYIQTSRSGWYVTGTPRDWRYTVTRMNAHLSEISRGNEQQMLDVLSPEGEERVITFLTQYFGGVDAINR